MAEPESTNTMLQNSFEIVGDPDDGTYALRTTGSGSGGTPTEVTIDPAGNTVELDPAGNTVKLDQTDPNNKVRIADGQIVTIAEPLASRATSAFANGKVAAPAAGADIATTADLSAGTWDITCTIAILGTTVANNETDNVKFKIGAGVVATPTVCVPGTAGSPSATVWKCRVNLGGPTPVGIEAGGNAGTAGSIYVADIVATKWENP